MRALLYILGISAVLMLSAMSYSQNYATRDVLREIQSLRGDIRLRQQQLRALEDEWAYLNRPKRIKELTVINYPNIELSRRSPGAPGKISDLPFLPNPSDYNPVQDVLE